MSENNERRMVTLKSGCLTTLKCPSCGKVFHIGKTTCRVHVYKGFMDAVAGEYTSLLQLDQSIRCPDCEALIFESVVSIDPVSAAGE